MLQEHFGIQTQVFVGFYCVNHTFTLEKLKIMQKKCLLVGRDISIVKLSVLSPLSRKFFISPFQPIFRKSTPLCEEWVQTMSSQFICISLSEKG